MHGLPVLFRTSHYPAIDVQAFPRAVLDKGKSQTQNSPPESRAFLTPITSATEREAPSVRLTRVGLTPKNRR